MCNAICPIGLLSSLRRYFNVTGPPPKTNWVNMEAEGGCFASTVVNGMTKR